MPTGYTDSIKNGITFEQFVLQCSRAFGIGNPDEPLSSDVHTFKPSTYYMEQIVERQNYLRDLEGTSVDCAQLIADREYVEETEKFQTRLKEIEDLKAKYEAMLDSVWKWVPPTEEHATLKSFMVKQLTMSIDFDCDIDGYVKYQSPKKLSGQEWLDEKISRCKSDIEYYTKENKKEINRIDKRNAWVSKLRESLKDM